MSGDIDVVIPCFNGARYLAQTLDSVLAQTEPDVRVLVVDDGSTDASKAIVARYAGRVDYVYQPNAGQAAARNHGLRRTSRPFVCLLDADDLLVPDALERLRARLLAEPDLAACHGKTLEFRDEDLAHPRAESWRPFAHWSDPLEPFSILCAVDICSVLFRRETLVAHGGFPEDRAIQGCEDWSFWLHATSGGAKLAAIDTVTLLYRRHAGASSANRRRVAVRESELMRRAATLFSARLDHADRRHAFLDVGLKATALRWWWLGERAAFEEIAVLARTTVDSDHRDPALDRSFETPEHLGGQVLHLLLADRLLALSNPLLATILLLRARDVRRLRARARRAGFEAALDRVLATLAAYEAAVPLELPQQAERSKVSGLPEHASTVSELRYQFGLDALGRGAKDEAARHFERALASDPHFAVARLGLTRARWRTASARRDWAAAVAALRADPERGIEHLLPVDADDPIVGPLFVKLATEGRRRADIAEAVRSLARFGGRSRT